jgi:predicted 2-oxoglutarate/Fe(II)-dependent dioxygenase YbiX
MALFTADDVLDEAICRWVQTAMDTGVTEPAAVLRDAIDIEVEARRASDVEVATEVIALVESRLDAFRDAIAAFYGLTLRDHEGCGFLRYEAGGFYGPHVDRAEVPSWPGASRREITVVVFLNGSTETGPTGEFGGGVLRVFPRGIDGEAVDIVPGRGRLIAFPSAFVHEVTVVTHGRRDAVIDWFY